MYFTLDPGFPFGIRPRLSLRSSHARAREALADLREIIVLSRGRVHEFVIHFRGNVKEFVHAAIRELQLKSPKGIRIFVVSDFCYAVRGNGDPVHLLRAPFRCGASSSGRYWGPSGHSPSSLPWCSACSSWAAIRGSSPDSCSNSRILMQSFVRNYQILQSLCRVRPWPPMRPMPAIFRAFLTVLAALAVHLPF